METTQIRLIETFKIVSLMILTLLSLVIVSNITQGLSDSESFGLTSLTLLPLVIYTVFTK